ncbi:hypothetical protein HDR62_00225 [bacterium]|nr:hypothetical protein [bacterium]
MKRFSLQIWIFIGVMTVTLVLIGTVLPYNQNGYLREFFVKERILQNPERHPAIILVGGSNVAFGFNSPFIEDSLGIPVINTGLISGLGLKCMVEKTLPYLEKGDILVLSPEYEHFFENVAYGAVALTDLFFLNKGKDAYMLNPIQWRILIQNTPRSLRNKVEDQIIGHFFPNKETVYRLSSFNSNGDVVAHWQQKHDLLKITTKKQAPRKINARFVDWLGEQLQNISEKDIHTVILPPILAATSFANIKDEIDLVDSALRKIGFPFICAPEEMAYPDSLFYDGVYHLDSLGAAIHSDDLIRILNEHNIVPRQNVTIK